MNVLPCQISSGPQKKLFVKALIGLPGIKAALGGCLNRTLRGLGFDCDNFPFRRFLVQNPFSSSWCSTIL